MTKLEGKRELEYLFDRAIRIFVEMVPEEDYPVFLKSIALGMKFAMDIYEQFENTQEN